MSTTKLLFCLGIVSLFAAPTTVSAAENTLARTQKSTTETTFSASETATYSTMRPKKKRAAKKKGKHGCEAYH